VTARLEKIQPQNTVAPLKTFNDGNSARSRATSDPAIHLQNPDLRKVAARQPGPLAPTAERPALRTEELRFQSERGAKEQPANSTSELWKLHHSIQRLLRPPVAEDGTRKRGPSVCGCGYASTANDDVTLHVRRTGSRPQASVSGVYRCGSPWLCPICSKRTAIQRQARVQKVAEATQAQGGIIAHVVITVRHKRGQSLAELKAAVTESSRAARSGRAWKAIQASGQVLGVLSAPEVTYSTKAGWHFHVHQGIPMLTSDVDRATAACKQFVERYLQELEKRGFDANWNGQHVSISHDPQGAAAYIGKGLSWEIAGGTANKAKARLDGSLAPFEIARRAANGSEQMRALWLEYAAVMPGTRSCVITAALAKHLEIQTEDVDGDEEDSTDETEPTDVVGTLPTINWNTILRLGHAPRLLGELETREAAAWPAIRAWAIKVSTELRPEDIPCESAPAAASIVARMSRSDLTRTIAWRGLETMPGRRFIESEVGRLQDDWMKFGGPNPPGISDVVGCLAKISRESKPAMRPI